MSLVRALLGVRLAPFYFFICLDDGDARLHGDDHFESLSYSLNDTGNESPSIIRLRDYESPKGIIFSVRTMLTSEALFALLGKVSAGWSYPLRTSRYLSPLYGHI